MVMLVLDGLLIVVGLFLTNHPSELADEMVEVGIGFMLVGSVLLILCWIIRRLAAKSRKRRKKT